MTKYNPTETSSSSGSLTGEQVANFTERIKRFQNIYGDEIGTFLGFNSTGEPHTTSYQAELDPDLFLQEVLSQGNTFISNLPNSEQERNAFILRNAEKYNQTIHNAELTTGAKFEEALFNLYCYLQFKDNRIQQGASFQSLMTAVFLDFIYKANMQPEYFFPALEQVISRFNDFPNELFGKTAFMNQIYIAEELRNQLVGLKAVCLSIPLLEPFVQEHFRRPNVKLSFLIPTLKNDIENHTDLYAVTNHRKPKVIAIQFKARSEPRHYIWQIVKEFQARNAKVEDKALLSIMNKNLMKSDINTHLLGGLIFCKV